MQSWTAGNDTVRVYTAGMMSEHKEVTHTCGGMLLVALLSGNDYNPMSQGSLYQPI